MSSISALQALLSEPRGDVGTLTKVAKGRKSLIVSPSKRHTKLP